MDLLLGIASVLQITILPGLILLKCFEIKGNILDKLLYAFGLSLIFNYCLVAILVILDIYTRPIFFIFFLSEIIGVLWLYRRELFSPVNLFFDNAWNDLISLLNFFPNRGKNDNEYILKKLLVLSLFLLALKNVTWGVNNLIGNIGTVFSSWDAVVSWNRWAVDWANGILPTDSHFYPQLVPANWSISYLMLGSTLLQFFAKGIMPLFALLILLGFINLAIKSQKMYPIISLVFIVPLLKEFVGPGISNGYVDIVVAYFAFIAIYTLLQISFYSEDSDRRKNILLAATFTAGAALTKQSGVYIALIFPLLAILIISQYRLETEWKYRKLFVSFAIISMIWVTWYLYKEIMILKGMDTSHLDVLIELSADEYGGTGVFGQMFSALSQFGPYILVFGIILISLPLMNAFFRLFMILLIPYPLLWAWMAGYDMRNLTMLWPLIAIIAGYSIECLLDRLTSFYEGRRKFQFPLILLFLLVLAAVAYLGISRSSGSLAEKQIELQKQIFSPSKNEILYELVDQNNQEFRVLTNYPMEYLPNLGDYKLGSDFKDFDTFVYRLSDPRVKYLLVPNNISDQVQAFLDEGILTGKLEVVVKDREWKPYTLIRVIGR